MIANLLSRLGVLTLLALAPLLAAAPPIRILPVGDSITFGSGGTGGYRVWLYNLLTNAGYNVDFTGTQTGNGHPDLPDPDHEGHSGWRIDQIDSILPGVYAATADPDIILVLIGTNDYGQNHDTANATNRLEGLIARMATNRPHAKIIVANLLTRGEPQNTQIQTTFNPFVESICQRQHALGREVYFNDLRSSVPLADMPDNLHPNSTGYAKMATNWFRAITNHISPLGTTNAPALVRALGLPGRTNVTVTFSKPVSDSATNLDNYSIDGLTILAATLDSAARRTVTLTTSPHEPRANYVISVSGVQDLAAGRPLSTSTVSFSGAANRGAFENVSEAAGFTLVHSLEIPDSALYGNPSYSVDNRANIGPFTRVAYYLELQLPGSPLHYLWVSMDPFTSDINKIGVPTVASGAVFQQTVTNMNVFSSQADIVTGIGLPGGNIEFWPQNYTSTNIVNVPGASTTAYDWGDQATPGGYGSMQVHNNEAGQVLFAFNHWGTSGGVIDLGIGNGFSNPDWTFANNAPGYTIKTLQVFVQPESDTTAPTALRAIGTTNYSTIQITFSEPLHDNAANAALYYIEGLTVLDATLDPVTRSVVTLTTTPQVPLTSYEIWFVDFSDRFGNVIDGLTPLTFISSAGSGVFANVPEAADYSLVYSLSIPVAAMFNTSNVLYSVDLRQFATNFTRVAYYLELQQPSGAIDYVWAALDPFTPDAGKIGVPTGASGAVFQQPITNLTVRSSVPGVKWLTNAIGGNIEFWPGNYSAPNALNVPNASGTALDWGDTLSTGNGHGSMQLHNSADSQVVFAFNNWGGPGTSDNVALGIGNNTGNANPDWTFMANGATYSARTLQVFVLPADSAQAPALFSAEAQPGWSNVLLRFSEPLSDAATNPAHYLIDGLTVTTASLDPTTKTVVTLATTPQQPGKTYVVTVSGLVDRSASAVAVPANSTATFVTHSLPLGNVYANVPSAANWALVYALNVPTSASYHSTGVVYSADNRYGVSGYSRVAYYLELGTPGGVTNFIWAEMDPFTQDATKLGVPTLANGIYFQQPVSNLTVYSSAANVLPGASMSAGNIEFWPWDYTTSNARNIPNGSAAAFDFADTASLNSGGYGSMQIHNTAAGQTLLAINNFGGTGGGDICLGIGNNTSSTATDWTHVKNAAGYSHRKLMIFVLPAPDTTAPSLVSAVYALDLNHIVLTFDEPLADSAAWLPNFSLSGATILSAELQPNLREVVLTTPLLNAANTYQITLTNVRDRSGANQMGSVTVPVAAPSLPGQILSNVSESSEFKLVYKLNLPVANPGLNLTGTVYEVDNRSYTGPFTRVAYYLELATNGGPTNWVYVSMDAFTADVNKIGIPDMPSGAHFQQKVTNMNVFSSQPNIVTGTGMTTGNIEFWPLNYSRNTTGLIPTGSGSGYDWNDITNNVFSGGTEGHGSMQVHNHGAYGTGQVIFAYNNWGKRSGAVGEMGIGNRPGSADADWTSAANGSSYVLKNLYVLVLPAADSTGPSLLKATPSSALTNVVVSFNEPLADSATNAANFSLSGGATVLSAEMRPGLRELILTTSPLAPATSYTLTVDGVADRSSSANVISAGTTTTFTTAPVAPVFGRVPEASNYLLVYHLAVPSAAPNYNVNGVPYAVDLRGSITQPFNRVAYYLELAPTVGGVTNWVYVSADAFTPLVGRIGVPALGSGALFQQKLTNMNVRSGVNGIVTGNGITTGNMEFWPWNYAVGTNNIVPVGSNTAFDWNDTYNTGGQFGCMQIHNHGAGSTGQVLFAFNKWGGGQSGNVDLGIGNSGAAAVDWTQVGGASTNAVRNLYVLVQTTNVTVAAAATVPPEIVVHPTSRSVAAGTNVLLTAQATGTRPAFQWRRNGEAISGATNAWLELSSVHSADAGGYDLVAWNMSGSATSLVAFVSVITSEPVPLNVVSGPYLTSTNTFYVQFSGTPGARYLVEAAEAVTGPWEVIGTVSAAGNGLVEVLETLTPPLPAQRYYRVRPEQP